jgi:hypothetical protein
MLQRKGVIFFMVAGCMMNHTLYMKDQNVPFWRLNFNVLLVLISSISNIDGSPMAANYQFQCAAGPDNITSI